MKLSDDEKIPLTEDITDGLSYIIIPDPENPGKYLSRKYKPEDHGGIGTPGPAIELQNTGTYIQWRVVGDTTWINLVSIASITGANGQNGTNGSDGDDGREIEIQKGTTHIQWRYVGDTSWTNLVALADLKGDKGDIQEGAELAVNKDASGGYVGKTLEKINFWNAARTFMSFLTNAATAARIWTFPDKDGTVAMTSDILTSMTSTSFISSIKLDKIFGRDYNINLITTNNEITLDSIDIINGGRAIIGLMGDGVHTPGLTAFTKLNNLGYDYDETINMINVFEFIQILGKSYYNIINQYQYQYQKAIRIATSNNVISLPYTNYSSIFNSTHAFSICCRIRFTNANALQSILSTANEDSSKYGMIFRYNTSDNRFYLIFIDNDYTNLLAYYIPTSLQINTWYNIQFTYNGLKNANSCVIHIEGINYTTFRGVNSLVNVVPCTKIRCGIDTNNTVANTLDLSDLVIINKALNSTELTEAYNSGYRFNYALASFANSVISWHKFDYDIIDYVNDNDGSVITPNYVDI